MAAAPTSSPSTTRSFEVLVTIIIATTALYFGQKVLIPVALALLLAFVLNPLVLVLQRRGLRRVPAVLIVVLLAFGVLGGLLTVLLMQVRSLAERLPEHEGEISHKFAQISGEGEEGTFTRLEKSVENVMRGYGAEQPQLVRVETSPFTQFETWVSPVAEGLAEGGLVVILVIFMLIQREDLRNRVVRLIGRGRLVHTTRALDEAAHRISRYLVMQVCINASFGIALGVGLFLVGVDYALLWGFLAGSLRFIPYVGSYLAGALLGLFTLAFAPGWGQMVWSLGLFLGLETVTAQVLEPLLFGHSTGMSSLALLVAAAFWAWLWGPVGLILSTPLTVCLVVLGKYVPQLEFLGVLLSDEPVLEDKVTFYQRLLAHDQDEAIELVEQYLEKHPLETIYDNFLLPALLLARRDRERGELAAEDEAFIYQTIGETLDDLLLRQQQIQAVAEHGAAALQPERPRVLIVGCPARDDADELALRMFSLLLDPLLGYIEVLSPRKLAAEMTARVEKDRPALVCIASLPPGGIAQARYLCKRLHAQFPDLPLLVGRWGQRDNVDQMEARLQADGATHVDTTMLESLKHATPILQLGETQVMKAGRPKAVSAAG